MTWPDAIRWLVIIGAAVALIEIGVIVGIQALIGMTRSQSFRFVALAFALMSIIVGSVRFLGTPANWNLPLNSIVVGYSLAGLWKPARSRRSSYREHADQWDGVERRRNNDRRKTA